MTSQHPPLTLSRRHLLSASTAALGATLTATIAPNGASAATSETDSFAYEVTRSEQEWRDMLTPAEYQILREGGTEPRQSSLNAFEVRDGVYHCRGCDLPAFTSDWKVAHYDIGWAFFRQAVPNSVLTAIDLNFDQMGDDNQGAIECHCRRCGSHIGHILHVRDEVLHCLNGASLVFKPA